MNGKDRGISDSIEQLQILNRTSAVLDKIKSKNPTDVAEAVSGKNKKNPKIQVM